MSENPTPRHPEDPQGSSSTDGSQAARGSAGSPAAPDQPSSYFSAEPDGSAKPYSPAGDYPLPGSSRPQHSQYPGQPGAGQQPQSQHPGGYGAPNQYGGGGYGTPNQYAGGGYGTPNQYAGGGYGAPNPYGGHGGYPGQNYGYMEQKSKIVAGLLGILLGGFGIHRFYLGYPGIGVAQIFVSLVTFGFGSLWGFIEGILILVGAQSFRTDARGIPLKE